MGKKQANRKTHTDTSEFKRCGYASINSFVNKNVMSKNAFAILVNSLFGNWKILN
jgi:hypothetical protein